MENLWSICFFNLFPAHVGNSFDNIFVEVLPIVRNSFARSSEVKLKRVFQKKFFSSNCTPWTRRKQFWQLYGKIFCQMSEKNLLEVRVCTKNIKKFEQICFLNWFSEQVETSLDNLSVKILLNIRKKLSQKSREKKFSKTTHQSVCLNS